MHVWSYSVGLNLNLKDAMLITIYDYLKFCVTIFTANTIFSIYKDVLNSNNKKISTKTIKTKQTWRISSLKNV
jgi:hypothetical protein